MKNSEKFSKWVSELTWKSVGQFFVRVFVAVMAFFNIPVKKQKNDLQESIIESSLGESAPAAIVDETSEFEADPSTIEEEIPVRPDAFVVDEHDSSLFHSLKSKALHIRVVKSPSGSKTKNKDEMVFVCSLHHELKAAEVVLSLFPQLVFVDSSKSHEVLVLKSAASNFDELMEPILHFLFAHLYRRYSWMEEKQPVFVDNFGNGTLQFNLRLETQHHLRLGTSLISINGIERPLAGSERFPLCMDHEKNYDFNLTKAKMFTWEELLPEIKKVFNDYFPAGVEFKGFMQ
jgi:hypothetical protein